MYLRTNVPSYLRNFIIYVSPTHLLILIIYVPTNLHTYINNYLHAYVPM